MTRRHARLLLAGFLSPAALGARQIRAERTNYAETSTRAGVVALVDSMQARGARIHVGIIGRTTEGREVPYIIASRPLATTPIEARRLGRPRQDVYVVRTTQPLGVLAVELLEPQSDDGLVTWNFVDAHPTDATVGKPYPVLRVTRPIAFPTRILR